MLLGIQGFFIRVGKTSVIIRFAKGKFSDQYRVTVGADLFNHDIVVDDKKIQMSIWDTAGQEKFQSIGAAFYRGSDACLVVCDVTNQNVK